MSGHPDWCAPGHCTVYAVQLQPGLTRRHRSASVTVDPDDPQSRFRATLWLEQDDAGLVEIGMVSGWTSGAAVGALSPRLAERLGEALLAHAATAVATPVAAR